MKEINVDFWRIFEDVPGMLTEGLTLSPYVVTASDWYVSYDEILPRIT